MIRCSSSWIERFVPDPGKIAQVDAGTVYPSNPLLSFVLDTAMKYLHCSSSLHALTPNKPMGGPSIIPANLWIVPSTAAFCHI